MNKDENQENEKNPLEINEGDEIYATDTTACIYDLTVIIPSHDGKDKHLIIEEGTADSLITASISDALGIPPDKVEGTGLKELVEEEMSITGEIKTKGEFGVPIPTGCLKYIGFPKEINPKIKFIKTETSETKIVKRYKHLDKSKESS